MQDELVKRGYLPEDWEFEGGNCCSLCGAALYAGESYHKRFGKILCSACGQERWGE